MEKREITVYKETFGRRNSLQGWRHVRHPLKVLYNYLLIGAARRAPSLRLKNALYRRTGMKIGKNTAIAAGVMLDFFFPEMIEIGSNVIIGYNTTILTHEFLHEEWRTGRVKIGDNALIGAWTLVMPGSAVGDGAQVAAFSLVNKKVPAGERVGGVPIKIIR